MLYFRDKSSLSTEFLSHSHHSRQCHRSLLSMMTADDECISHHKECIVHEQ